MKQDKTETVTLFDTAESKDPLPSSHTNEVDAAFNEGRNFQKAFEEAIANFIARAGDTPKNRRTAAALFWEFVEQHLAVPAVRLKVRIYRRFGDSPFRNELSRLFGIGEISMLVFCSDEVVQMAIDAKWHDHEFSRAKLHKLIREAPGEKAERSPKART